MAEVIEGEKERVGLLEKGEDGAGIGDRCRSGGEEVNGGCVVVQRSCEWRWGMMN